jgi:hypothetical protein
LRYDWRIVTAAAVAAALAGWLLMRSGGGEPDTADIDRELAELAQALRGDQTIVADLLPPAVPGGSFPSTFEYRSLALFWQPAMGAGRAHERPRRRKAGHE